MFAERDAKLHRQRRRHGVTDQAILVRPFALKTPCLGKGLNSCAFAWTQPAQAQLRVAYPVLMSVKPLYLVCISALRMITSYMAAGYLFAMWPAVRTAGRLPESSGPEGIRLFILRLTSSVFLSPP